MITITNSFSRGSLLAAARGFCRGLAAWGWLAAVGSLQAATSGIVGYYPLTLPAGNSCWVCGLVTADEYQSAITGVTADVDGKALITFSAPGWTPGQFSLHYAEPLSGIREGLAIDILSNTADTLKLDITPTESGITAGMVFVVRKHATLIGLFPAAAGFTTGEDTIGIVGVDGTQKVYLWRGSPGRWTNALNQNLNNTVVRPAQGMLMQVGTAKTITLGAGEACHVKTGKTQVKLLPSIANLVGSLDPLNNDTTLEGLGVRTGFTVGADTLVVLQPGTLARSHAFSNNGTNWINALRRNSNTYPVLSGAGVVVGVSSVKYLEIPPFSGSN
jgi:hypothetical protein